MYFDDHNPPHFHALLGRDAVQIKIADLSMLAGRLPHSAMNRVLAWAAENQDFLAAQWLRLH
jgi:hypothetical protein